MVGSNYIEPIKMFDYMKALFNKVVIDKENDSLVILFEKLYLCLLGKYFSKQYFYIINFSHLSYPELF